MGGCSSSSGALSAKAEYLASHPKGAPEISADLSLISGDPFGPPPLPKWEVPDLGDLSNFGEFAPNTGDPSMAQNRD